MRVTIVIVIVVVVESCSRSAPSCSWLWSGGVEMYGGCDEVGVLSRVDEGTCGRTSICNARRGSSYAGTYKGKITRNRGTGTLDHPQCR